IQQRMKREFKVDANVGRPRVSYRETVSSVGTGEGKIVRKLGDKGQYGHVVLKVEPCKTKERVEVLSLLKPGDIPREFVPTVIASAKSSAESGLSGYPIIDIRITLVGGSTHPTDSAEVAYAAATSEAFSRAAEAAGLVLLEPIM